MAGNHALTPALKPTSPPALKPTSPPALKPTSPPALKPTSPPWFVTIDIEGVETNHRGKEEYCKSTTTYSIPPAFQDPQYHSQLEGHIRRASTKGTVDDNLQDLGVHDDPIHGLRTRGRDRFEVTRVVFEQKKDLGDYPSVLEIITDFPQSKYRVISMNFTKESMNYLVHHPFPICSHHRPGTNWTACPEEKNLLVERYKKIYDDKGCENISVSFNDISAVLSTKLGRRTFCYWTPDIPPIEPQPTALDLKISRLDKELSDKLSDMSALVATQQEQIAHQQEQIAQQQEQIAQQQEQIAKLNAMMSAILERHSAITGK
jgi:hypothetical protein